MTWSRDNLRRLAAAGAVTMALAAGVLAPVGASDGTEGLVSLTAIESRVDGAAGVVTIEASEPVPYVASQPDPRTLVVELRQVSAAGHTNGFAADPRNPVTAVAVEPGVAADGAVVARVRLSLADAGRPRVRSDRNRIVVEAVRDEWGGAAGIAAAGPATAVRDLRISDDSGVTTVTLIGTGPLPPAQAVAAPGGASGIYLDLPNVTRTLPQVTPVDRDPVRVVRSSLVPDAPLTTRVALELSRDAAYRVDRSPGGDALTITFGETPPDPLTLLTERAPAQQQGVPPSNQGLAQQGGAQPGPAAPPVEQFTGEPISLDFQDADLRAVLRVFADVSGLNVVIDPSVQGTVDVALRDVPWDQALDIILRANRLGYSVEGTIVRIAPLTALAQEEAERAALAAQQALAGELGVETVTLSYARATDLAPLITQTVLSARGSIQTDVRTNTLIISDLAQQLDDARALIGTLDVPQPQVEIEARIIQTSRDFAQALGVQWGASGQATAALGNTLPTTFPNELAGTAGVDLGITDPSSILGVALGSINGAVGLDVALSALEREGQLRILSTPRVATQNNVQAEIAQGFRVPIQTVANNTVTIQYVDAALTLLVTPQITADDTVIMNIQVDNGDIGPISVGNNPIITTQRAVTQVLVSDGETTVIGGIYESTERTSEERTPVLSRIPLLGWLFRNQNVSDESQELLIFITPRITRL